MEKFKVDKITWNDLSLDSVLTKIDKSQSSVGKEYLKMILETMLCDEKTLIERSERAEYLSSDSVLRKKLRNIFKGLGMTKKESLYSYIFRFNEIKKASNVIHYFLMLLFFLAVVLIFIKPVFGVIALVVMFFINIGSYFKYKAAIEGYFMCFKYIVKMVNAAERILKITNELKSDSFSELINCLNNDVKTLSSFRRNSWLITSSVSGSPVDVILDYIRMLTHVDIIKFNNMRKKAEDKTQIIDNLFCSLGEIEADICISIFRDERKNAYCLPEFISNSEIQELSVKNVYHPLTSDPVKNSLITNSSVLLTGSNASGKSTFLKTIAINQIFAQTIYTCLAEEFKTSIYKVLTSMALTDSILNNESYFIVEIKSLKRIFDEIGDTPVMCFIDEVLRGTNTKERIAASSQILKKLSESNVLCFAATHDIELTELLSDCMDNYHFEENVVGDDVKFDYVIKKGVAKSRNAIKLLASYGFNKEIIEAAEALVETI